MAESGQERGAIFLSYSHKDTVWLERLKIHLKPLEQAGLLNVWDDRRIAAGAAWQEEINRALASASVAVLLVSPSFHASDFIAKYELPALKEHTTILWVPISATVYRHTPLAAIQAAHDPDQPLDGLTPSKRNKALVAICEQIIDAYQKGTQRKPSLASPHPENPMKERQLERFSEPARSNNNLPAQVTSFIGREKEIDEVKNVLAASRLLTLTGSGGCGKTRLALHVAGDVLEEYPDGVWLVELASLADPTLVAQTVASMLGIKEQPRQPLQQTLIEILKSKRLLLLMDNCEHLIDACAQLFDTLLKNCPHVTILASSREGLRIAGEQTYRVPSLSVPSQPTPLTPESLSRYESVRLFIERALAVQPQFALTASNAAPLAQTCVHLDGIPLAIELAAARVRALSVEEINTHLDNRFRLLTGGSRTALPRHQTLRALIDWSYDLLNEPEKTLLHRLSVFTGGWTLGAAEAVGSGEAIGGGEGIEDFEVLDLLTSLVDKSLVVVEAHAERTRYRLLETVRQYAWDRLVESGESNVVRERHRGFFLAFAEETEPKLYGAEQVEWLQRLEEEHENLRTGLDWSLLEGGSREGLRLCGALQRFWWTRGHLSEGRAWCKRALGKEGGLERTPERAKALNGAGVLTWMQDDYASARAYYEESLGIYREIGDRSGIADSLNGLGNVSYFQGDDASARIYFEESLTLSREIENRDGIADSLTVLACPPQPLPAPTLPDRRQCPAGLRSPS